MSNSSSKTGQGPLDMAALCLALLGLLADPDATLEDGGTPDAARIRAAVFSTEDLYCLVQWPWVQDLMEHEWFRQECILHQAFGDQEHLSSAYFVPVRRMLEIGRPG